MPAKDEVTLTLTRSEALALERAADTGLRVIEALALAQRTAAMDAALAKLSAAT